MSKNRSLPIKESDLTAPTLELLSKAPNGFLQTSELIDQLEDLFKPEGIDAEILEGRHDTHFSQKVRNIISHREVSGNPIQVGLIEYDKERSGLRITDAGSKMIKSAT
jgi:hypothetical protein